MKERGIAKSKRGSGSSTKIQGFTARESQEIATVEKLFRKTDFYKNIAEQSKIAAGTMYDTTAKLSRSSYFVDRLEGAIVSTAFDAFWGDASHEDFTIKQTKYVADKMLKELGSDNPKWKKYRK